MTMKCVIGVLLVLMLVLILVPATKILGCGPFFPEPEFTKAHAPDSLPSYIGGNIGIPQPSYFRAYLFIAYRNLSGKRFDPDEQEALAHFGESNLSPGTDEEAVQKWVERRAQVPDAGPDKNFGDTSTFEMQYGGITRSDKLGDMYVAYQNCHADAFLTAVDTLNKRAAKWGTASAEVRDWVRAQDAVFANCGGSDTSPAAFSEPPPASPGAPPLVRADRAYQRAAAFFYGGKFQDAQRSFEEISRDKPSPWHAVASLLVARTLIRRATLAQAIDVKLLDQAAEQLKRVQADPDAKDFHASAERLVSYVQVRAHPDERLHALGTRLLTDGASALRQDLTDYTLLMDKFVEQPHPDASGQSDLTDWIVTFQDTKSQARSHAIQRWKATGSLPWLVAALTKSHGSDAEAPALLKAAQGVLPGSPGFIAVAYHRARLVMETGKRDEARSWVDSTLAAQRAGMPPSSVNQFLALRLHLARNLDELLKAAPRTPADFADPGDPEYAQGAAAKYTGAYFDADAARIFTSKLPLALLLASAENGALPANLRRQVAIAAWTRAVVLDNDETGQRAARLLMQLEPQLKAGLDAYLSADKESRKFSAVFLILQFPGLRVFVPSGVGREQPLNAMDSLRDNWWCRLASATHPDLWERAAMSELLIPAPLAELYSGDNMPPLSFLTSAEQAAAAAEWERVAGEDGAPNYFARQVIAFAGQHPADPRVPEALHYAVRATRYGCGDEHTAELSEKAFKLLHSRYANTPWAKKTKYWFGAS